MKVTWKGEFLADFDIDMGFDVDEMLFIEKELPEFKNPAKLGDAAIDLQTRKPVIDHKTGKQITDPDGKPMWEIVPSEAWSPRAFRMFICVMGRRAGKAWMPEDVKGFLGEMQVAMSDAEVARITKAAEAAGKASAPKPTPTRARTRTTSKPGSGSTRRASGNTSA